MITLPGSEYFTLRPLKRNRDIYAAIAKEDSPIYSNAGVIDTGDHLLIFDTFNSFRAAEDLRRDTEIITKRLVDYVVNSHAHSDHWLGNQVFEDHAKLMATRRTQDAMMEWLVDFRATRRNPDEFKAYIGETEKNLAAAEDPRLKAHLSWTLTAIQHEFENLEATEPQIPNNSFDSKLDIYGTEALVKLIAMGTGHSKDDLILVIPEDKIAFIGDLGFFDTHPYLGDSDPDRWVATLDDLIQTKINLFVPGHGPIGTKANLKALKAYILSLQSMAEEVVKRGDSEDEAAAQPIPEFAAKWAGFGRFEKSMRFLYQRLKNKDEPVFDNISRILKPEALAAGYHLKEDALPTERKPEKE
jgi:glyoxylase-like metal-dependent hydrolase (beta-lactamase superfamily II)